MYGRDELCGLELGAHVLGVTSYESLPELACYANCVGGRRALPQADDAVLGRHPYDRSADSRDGSRRHQVRDFERRVRRPGLDARDPAHGLILDDPRVRCRIRT